MISDFEEDIIEKLKIDLGYEGPQITQEQFDNMVDYIMNDKEDDYNKHELIWRLSGCYEGLNLNKVVDIFIDARDSYYLPELVSYVDGNLDQAYLVEKMIKTNDVNFIKESMDFCFDLLSVSLKYEHYEKLIKFCKNAQK